MTRLRLLPVLLVALLAAVLPAAASAAPSWHELAQPPGGDSIAAGDGRAYVAYVKDDLVHVDQLTDLGWQQVGGVVAHDPRLESSDPSLKVAGDGHPWVTWVEEDSSGVGRVRVARFGHGSWHEIPGGTAPVNKGPAAVTPQLAFASGRAYVAYDELGGREQVRVARLRDGSTGWDVIPGDYGSAHSAFKLVTAGGRLFYGAGFDLGDSTLVRLKADGSGFETQSQPVNHARFLTIANLDGSLGFLYADEDDPFAVGPPRVAELDSAGRWSSVGAGIPVEGPNVLAEVGGTPYVAGFDSNGDTVARLERGAWRSLPPLGTQVTAVVDVRGAPWVLWRGGGSLHLSAFGEGPPDLPDGVDPVKPERGDCGFLKRGGAFSDALVGTAARDTLFGFAGDDWLLGRGGRDCLHGGKGGDRVYGGPHADFLFGDGGRDRMHGGKGHDVTYGGTGGDTIYPERGSDDVAAGPGNDTIRAVRGSVDHVNCGRGYDVLYASTNDGWRNCERVVLRRR